MSEGEANKLEQAVYWIRVALGALLGIIYAAFWTQDLGGLLPAFSIAVTFYFLSYYAIRIILGQYRVELLGGSSNVLKIGIGIYFVSWIFFWIFTYSLFFYVG